MISYLCTVNLINHKILITMEKLIERYTLFNDMEELDILGYSQSTHAFYVLVRLEPTREQKRAFSGCVKTDEGNYSLQLMHADIFNQQVTKGFFNEFFI